MRKADADYQSALAAARAKHGVVVVAALPLARISA
jgi:hypothetical protein